MKTATTISDLIKLGFNKASELVRPAKSVRADGSDALGAPDAPGVPPPTVRLYTGVYGQSAHLDSKCRHLSRTRSTGYKVFSFEADRVCLSLLRRSGIVCKTCVHHAFDEEAAAMATGE